MRLNRKQLRAILVVFIFVSLILINNSSILSDGTKLLAEDIPKTWSASNDIKI